VNNVVWGDWNRGKTKETDDRIRRIAEASSRKQKGRPGNKEFRHKPETKEIMRQKSLDSWKNPVTAKKRFQKQKQNRTEIFLDYIIQTSCPKEFEYTGTGKIWIEGKCPDWFNVNGKKQVIELFGDYYHSKKMNGREKEQEEDSRKSHFAKYGYGCLIIWESELEKPYVVAEKIKTFVGRDTSGKKENTFFSK